MRNERLKIGNFGIKSVLESAYAAATMERLANEPCYLSPECFIKSKFESKFNEKNDVWALGCVMFEMCTLKAPAHNRDFLNNGAANFQLPEIDTSVRLKAIFNLYDSLINRDFILVDAK
jgi:serine/threonine protein kinase